MKEGDDYILLSEPLWRFIFDLYGCSNIVRLRYFHITESVPVQFAEHKFMHKNEKANYDYSILAIDDRLKRA